MEPCIINLISFYYFYYYSYYYCYYYYFYFLNVAKHQANMIVIVCPHWMGQEHYHIFIGVRKLVRLLLSALDPALGTK